MIPQHILNSFYYDAARKLNQARIDHLKSLNINFNNKKVLETGCGGCGDITKFLLSKNADVTLNDYRKENIESLMININKELPFNTYDLNVVIEDKIKFDIIVCYGTLYHLTDLENAFTNLANLCNEFVIISTCTSGQNDENKNIIWEGSTNEQSHNEYGSRPGRLYIWNQLNKCFKFVYTVKTQPNHTEYPLHFPSSNSSSRNIFIGSHIKLENDKFVSCLLNEYEVETETEKQKEKLIFIDKRDGFGSQFQSIVFYILYAKFNNLNYVHKKIKNMEHNYNNESDFIERVNRCMNIQGNYDDYDDYDYVKNINNYSINTSSREYIYRVVEENLDLYTTNNDAIDKIKRCFWENKDKDVYKNNKFNVAVHIRRPNIHDDRVEGTNTEDSYYLNAMNSIREKYKNKEDICLCFHIYSQGNIENFNCYKNDDVVFHINEEVTKTFVGLVGSDALVMSASSFSYIAAILTDAEVYYLPFWHRAKKGWITL